jgi:hypothetical protein
MDFNESFVGALQVLELSPRNGRRVRRVAIGVELGRLLPIRGLDFG